MMFSIVMFISILNVFLAIILFIFNFRKNRSVVFLSSFLIIYSLYSISGSILVDGGPHWVFALLVNNFTPFYYLLPVLLYLFVRTTVTDSIRFKKYDFLHFIPFFVSIITFLPYLFTSFEYKLSIAENLMCNLKAYMDYDFKLFYPHMSNQILQPVQFLLYLVSSSILLIRFYPKLKTSTGLVKTQFNFMIISLICIVIFFTTINLKHLNLAFLLLNQNDIQCQSKIFLRLASSMYFIIPLFILIYPRFLYGLPQIKESEIRNNDYIVIEEKLKLNDSIKTELPKEENENLIILSRQILHYIEREKPFLNPEFSVHDICNKLNAPRHHVQYCLNVIIQKKFADLKNELRVNYAKELLQSEDSKNISIEGIGKNVGFASASNFFFTFKKITGVTPNQWMTEMKNSKING